MLNTGVCPTSTAVLTVGYFSRRFLRQLDRLRLTTVYRDRTKPNETYIYTIHGQSAALQLIFAALGPFLQPKIWSKKFNKSIQTTIKAEIVTLSSLIWNSVSRDGK